MDLPFAPTPALEAVLDHVRRRLLRHAATPWLRMAVPGAVAGIGLSNCEQFINLGVARPGTTLLALVTVYALLVGVLAALATFQVLPIAHRQRQLDLIAITALTPRDILAMGTWPLLAEAWWSILYALPVVTLAAYTGGVSWGRAAVLVLLAASWVALMVTGAACLGCLFVALRSGPRSAGRALIAVLVLASPILLGFAAALIAPAIDPACGLAARQAIGAVVKSLVLATPIAGFLPTAAPWYGLLALALADLLAAAGLLWAGTWMFPREFPGLTTVTGAPVGIGRERPFDGWWSTGSGTRPPEGLAAVTWKEYHGALGGPRLRTLVVAFVIGAPIAFTAVVCLLAGRAPDALVVADGITGLAVVLLVLCVARALERSFSTEVRLGTLDALEALPFTMRALLHAKLAGIWRAVQPLAVIAAIGLPVFALHLVAGGAFSLWWLYAALLAACVVAGIWLFSLVQSLGAIDTRYRGDVVALVAAVGVTTPIVIPVVGVGIVTGLTHIGVPAGAAFAVAGTVAAGLVLLAVFIVDGILYRKIEEFLKRY
jgi:hypothetical protein